MIAGTWIIVAWGLIGAILLGLGMAFDATALFILALIILVGGIGLGATLKIRRASVTPGQCPNCGGLVSLNAPYCKHCYHPLDQRTVE